MQPIQCEMAEPARLDAMIRFDCRVRRWLGRVPLSTIVVLVDAIVDEMEVRARVPDVPPSPEGPRGRSTFRPTPRR